jgi:protein O-GlcNAc transferase
LQELRERLQRQRLSQPLFDSDRYRRHIESAYLRMWEIWQRREHPVSFSVAPDGGKENAPGGTRGVS